MPKNPLLSRERIKALKASDAHFSTEDKNWDGFVDHAQRKSFVKAVQRDPRADEKLKRHVDAMNRLQMGKVLATVPSTTSGRTYDIVRLRGGGLGCTCPNWRYRQSVSMASRECKHIKAYKSKEPAVTTFAEKTAEYVKEANLPRKALSHFATHGGSVVGMLGSAGAVGGGTIAYGAANNQKDRRKITTRGAMRGGLLGAGGGAAAIAMMSPNAVVENELYSTEHLPDQWIRKYVGPGGFPDGVEQYDRALGAAEDKLRAHIASLKQQRRLTGPLAIGALAGLGIGTLGSMAYVARKAAQESAASEKTAMTAVELEALGSIIGGGSGAMAGAVEAGKGRRRVGALRGMAVGAGSGLLAMKAVTAAERRLYQRHLQQTARTTNKLAEAPEISPAPAEIVNRHLSALRHAELFRNYPDLIARAINKGGLYSSHRNSLVVNTKWYGAPRHMTVSELLAEANKTKQRTRLRAIHDALVLRGHAGIADRVPKGFRGELKSPDDLGGILLAGGAANLGALGVHMLTNRASSGPLSGAAAHNILTKLQKHGIPVAMGDNNYYSPEHNTVVITPNAHPAVLAHEAGHALAQHGGRIRRGISAMDDVGRKYGPAAAMLSLAVSPYALDTSLEEDPEKAKRKLKNYRSLLVGAGLLQVPTLLEEGAASAIGAKLISETDGTKAGLKALARLSPAFATYATAASIPALAAYAVHQRIHPEKYEGRKFLFFGGKKARTVTKVAEVEYRGRTFPGYNTPVASNRPEKKKMVLAKKGDQVRLIHFGQKGYKHNYSEAAKKNYLARSAGIRGKGGLTKDDKFSANYWARKELWPAGEPADGTARNKEANLRAYAGDFTAGMDPLGTFVTDRAANAERQGASASTQRKRLAATTAGGIAGGAVVIPSAITGLTAAAKGFLRGSGGAQGRLAAAGRGLIEGARAPHEGLFHAMRANSALKQQMAGAATTAGQQASIRRTLSAAPIGGVIDAANAAQRAPGFAQQAEQFVTGAMSQGGVAPTALPKQVLPMLQSKVQSAVSDGATQLALGGGIGGLGAGIQYQKGRTAEIDTQKRIAAATRAYGTKEAASPRPGDVVVFQTGPRHVYSSRASQLGEDAYRFFLP